MYAELTPHTRALLRAAADGALSRSAESEAVAPSALRHELVHRLVAEVVTVFLRYGLRATSANPAGAVEFTDGARLAVWIRLPARIRDTRLALRGQVRETSADAPPKVKDVELGTIVWDPSLSDWVPADPNAKGTAVEQTVSHVLRGLQLLA